MKIRSGGNGIEDPDDDECPTCGDPDCDGECLDDLDDLEDDDLEDDDLEDDDLEDDPDLMGGRF